MSKCLLDGFIDSSAIVLYSRMYICSGPGTHLQAKSFSRNKNIYFHFMSFLHIDINQVFEILPQVRQGPTYSA